ncbi:MAG: 6-pyruvoyl-tetrahydropterin synthase-related protein [Bacilli bacterium]|nr:6-pyruvoyl-tetrahydropterin synthase-related protein [Bacilli bacterium]
MKKIKEKIFNEKTFPYLMILVVTILIGHPLLCDRIPYGHDLIFHFFRVRGTTEALMSGQIIPMIDSSMASGFGYAYNMFYGILPTYITGLINIVISDWALSYNILILLCIFFSGVFMYRFVRDISNNKIGIIASIIYISFPYFLTDIYIRSALGEILSFVFMPILFQGIYNLVNQDQSKFYYISIGMAGLFLSHNLSTFMSAIFATIYLLLNIKSVLKKKILKNLIISLAIGVLISLITLGPMLEAYFSTQYDVFHNPWMVGSANSMNSERLGLYRLFSSNLFRQYNDSNELLSGSMPFDLGFICIISLIALTFTYKKYKEKEQKIIRDFLFLGIIALIFTTVIINWNFMPSILYRIQFPWRFMIISTFFLSIICGFSLYKLFDKFSYKSLLLIILIIYISSSSITGFANYDTKVGNEIFEINSKLSKSYKYSSPTGSNEYFAKRMTDNLDKIIDMKSYNIIAGDPYISGYSKKGLKINFKINSSTETTIELQLAYYKGYKEKNGFEVFETNNGLVGIKIPPGVYQIKISYCNTTIQFISYIISIMTTISLTVYIAKNRKKEKIKDLKW